MIVSFRQTGQRRGRRSCREGGGCREVPAFRMVLPRTKSTLSIHQEILAAPTTGAVQLSQVLAATVGRFEVTVYDRS